MKKLLTAGLLALFAVAGLGSPSARSNPVISLILDNNTPVPGGTGTFGLSTFTYPEINGGRIVFATEDMTVWSATLGGKHLHELLDSNTPIPGTGGRKFQVGNGGWVQVIGDTAVVAGVTNNGTTGYYTAPVTGGRIGTLADQSLGSFGDPDFHVNLGQNQVEEVVIGSVTEPMGLAAFAIPVPGGEAVEIPPFPGPANGRLWCCNLLQPDISGGEIVVLRTNGLGEGAVQTVSSDGRPATEKILAKSDLPGVCYRYAGLQAPQIDGGTVVFEFTPSTPSPCIPAAGKRGIAAVSGGQRIILADAGKHIPGGIGKFNADCSFNSFAVRDGIVVFSGCDANQNDGIYEVSETGGTITKIVARGDTVEGGVVNDVAIGPEPLSNGVAVFLVYVFPQYYGLYAAQL